MTINIQIGKIMGQLRYKSHLESAATEEDMERRYMAEAGTEKSSELIACIKEAMAMAQQQLNRFLESYEVSGSGVKAHFVESQRRFQDKQSQLESLLMAFIVDYALMKYYVSVAKYDMSKAREQIAMAELQALRTSLYDKKPPKFE